ncbi:acyltransferase [Ferrimonas sp. SCSIO 43195]|uniref:acyltransferase n=1 Tax=Ferrimonas sp. SCSIO 43195 TaxID=2822844 RepID=UPI0020756220|nr:acyltransferase [Ferrimonas sp. SCSIO 43195]USD38668.1 acyltransferase [Ferrimonas sp. SCSIO 43195]
MRIKYFVSRALCKLYSRLRVILYHLLSDVGIPFRCCEQPVIFKGVGKIKVSENVSFGVESSPEFFSSYSYIEARDSSSRVVIGENCKFNNSLSIVAFQSKIELGSDCLVGRSVELISSDFHDLNPSNRFSPKTIKSKDIIIKNNVFIGNGVRILKGVTIGENSIISAGSVVTKSCKENSIIAGNPAKLIGTL